MKKILFVDDDLDFSKLILAVSKSFSTDIHHVQTVKDAVIALKKVKFDAYIIDGKLPDNPGLAIVKLIRKKLDKKNPIAFVSGYYRDTKSFTKIHEELQVDYVVNKPLSTEKMKKLLAMLLNIQDDSSEFDDEFLIELKKNYSKSIYIKLSRIEANINNFVSNPSSETQNDFRTEIHKIAGGAATYGFPKVTELCKNMETLIEQNKDFDPLTVLKNINIHSFFHKLKQEFILPEYNLDDHQQIEEISGNSIVQERLFFHSEDRYKVLYIKITDIIDDVDLVDKKIRSYFSKANIMIKMDTTSYLILMSLEKNPEAKQYLIKNLQQIGRNLPKNGKLLFTISSYPETGNG
ncbi:MAG: response regulator, partial [Candidatus Cloacimonadota bacterium]|nr:response regulator [Candidatus Cloacimonadota bacterium]